MITSWVDPKLPVLLQKEFNTELKRWILKVKKEAKSKVSDHKSIAASIKTKSYKKQGQIYKLALIYSKIGVFIHYGASKGHGGLKGSSWYNAKGEKKKTNPKSLGLMGKGERKAEPFITESIEKNLPELENIVQSYTDGLVVHVLSNLDKSLRI